MRKQEAFEKALRLHKQRWVSLHPQPKLKSPAQPKKHRLLLTWRFWIYFIPALGSSLIAALRTGAMAERVAVIDEFLGLPSEVEGIAAILGVELAMILGRLISVMNSNTGKSLEEVENVIRGGGWVKSTTMIAFTISVIANVSGVVFQMFPDVSPLISTTLDVAGAIALSIGVDILSVASAELIAFIVIRLNALNKKAQDEYAESVLLAQAAYEAAMNEYEDAFRRSWASSKNRVIQEVLDDNRQEQQVVAPKQEQEQLGQDDGKALLVDLIQELGVSGPVPYSILKRHINGSACKASVYRWADDLISEGKIAKAEDGYGWVPADN